MATLTKSTGTVILTGAAEKVTFPAAYGWVWVKNMSGSDIFAGLSADISEGADGVMTIPAGECGRIQTDGFKSVYLLGTGSVLVVAQNYADCPFQVAKKGGDVTAGGNPVTLGGLQGGVPFSEMVVSGKNLLKYPYSYTNYSANGIIFTDNKDGTITAEGTSTGIVYYNIANNYTISLKRGVRYTLSLNVIGDCSQKCDLVMEYVENNGSHRYIGVSNYEKNINFILTRDTDFRVWFRIFKDTTANCIIFPQLEIGDTATAYEQPITGRDITLTVNGTETTITPDTNPYVVPNDIRQRDGINNISVSAGGISVTGVRKNVAVKKIWDKLDELTTAIIVSNGEI